MFVYFLMYFFKNMLHYVLMYFFKYVLLCSVLLSDMISRAVQIYWWCQVHIFKCACISGPKV